jgi:hypothetical protein
MKKHIKTLPLVFASALLLFFGSACEKTTTPDPGYTDTAAFARMMNRQRPALSRGGLDSTIIKQLYDEFKPERTRFIDEFKLQYPDEAATIEADLQLLKTPTASLDLERKRFETMSLKYKAKMLAVYNSLGFNKTDMEARVRNVIGNIPFEMIEFGAIHISFTPNYEQIAFAKPEELFFNFPLPLTDDERESGESFNILSDPDEYGGLVSAHGGPFEGASLTRYTIGQDLELYRDKPFGKFEVDGGPMTAWLDATTFGGYASCFAESGYNLKLGVVPPGGLQLVDGFFFSDQLVSVIGGWPEKEIYRSPRMWSLPFVPRNVPVVNPSLSQGFNLGHYIKADSYGLAGASTVVTWRVNSPIAIKFQD